MADPTSVPYAQRDRVTTKRVAISTTTETELIAAGGVGVFRDLSSLIMSNESTTKVRVDIRDALAGTVRYSVELAPGTPFPITLPVPHPQAVANTAWTMKLSAAVGPVYVTAITIDN